MVEKKKCLNPFTPQFMNWTLPSLNLDTSADANRGFSLQSKMKWQTVYPNEGWLPTVSSGYTMFAQVFVYVCWSEKAKWSFETGADLR